MENVRSSKELGDCVYYDINGSLTARKDWLRKLNITEENSSMSYDHQWCRDMYELYMSTVYLTEPGWCVDYNVNGTRTVREEFIRELNIDLNNSSMLYDNQWCVDMWALYRSIYMTCFRLDHLDTTDVAQIIINFYMHLPVGIIGCIGNTLSIIVLYRDRKNYNTTNFLLLTLAIVDQALLVTWGVNMVGNALSTANCIPENHYLVSVFLLLFSVLLVGATR